MKMILKLLALPVLFVMKSVCILGNLLTYLSSHVIGLLLLILVGCGIYCVVQAMWTSLAILAGMGLVAIATIFFFVLVTVKAETITENIKNFIKS